MIKNFTMLIIYYILLLNCVINSLITNDINSKSPKINNREMEKDLNQNNQIELKKVWKSQEVNEGDGVRLQRIIGIRAMDSIDPFLMLDHILSIKLPAGFPDHPHRGFETVTYVLKGKFLHEDIKGHKGEIGPGEVQWMTAGKGIVHAEMPFSKTEESSGFQLWINLKSDKKMIDAYYQEHKRDEIPTVIDEATKTKLTIIAGNYKDAKGPCKSSSSEIAFIDITLPANTQFEFKVGKQNNGFIYVFEGEKVFVGEQSVVKLSAGLFESGDKEFITFENKNKEKEVRFLFVFGQPIRENLQKYGPFVMNTHEELEEAFNDYQGERNGFENRSKWKSQIKEKKYEL